MEGILKNIVARNAVRKNLSIKQQSYDAWRHVAEILLTSCPEDLMPREVRQTVLFELLQELLSKVFPNILFISVVFLVNFLHFLRNETKESKDIENGDLTSQHLNMN